MRDDPAIEYEANNTVAVVGNSLLPAHETTGEEAPLIADSRLAARPSDCPENLGDAWCEAGSAGRRGFASKTL